MPSGSPQSTAATAVRKRPRHTKRQLQEWRQGYVFLLPAVIILGIFIGISALFVIYLSFCKVNLYTNSYTRGFPRHGGRPARVLHALSVDGQGR